MLYKYRGITISVSPSFRDVVNWLKNSILGQLIETNIGYVQNNDLEDLNMESDVMDLDSNKDFVIMIWPDAETLEIMSSLFEELKASDALSRIVLVPSSDFDCSNCISEYLARFVESRFYLQKGDFKLPRVITLDAFFQGNYEVDFFIGIPRVPDTQIAMLPVNLPHSVNTSGSGLVLQARQSMLRMVRKELMGSVSHLNGMKTDDISNLMDKISNNEDAIIKTVSPLYLTTNCYNVALVARTDVKKTMLHRIIDVNYTERSETENVATLLLYNKNAKQQKYLYGDSLSTSELNLIARPWLIERDFFEELIKKSPDMVNERLIMDFLVWYAVERNNENITKLSDITRDNIKEYFPEWCIDTVYGRIPPLIQSIRERLTTESVIFRSDRASSTQIDNGEEKKLKIIVFSPHPDDDVISAGGCVSSLLHSGHDVHVSYGVSGLVAVNAANVKNFLREIDPEFFTRADSDRKIDFTKKENALFSDELSDFDPANDLLITEKMVKGMPEELVAKLRIKVNYMAQYKDMLISDNEEMRNILVSDIHHSAIKAAIRRHEAVNALVSLGMDRNVVSTHVHFLNMPFYGGSQLHKRGKPSFNDYSRVFVLLRKIRPHHILLAGDLSDPHGTHASVFNCIKAAINYFSVTNKNCARDNVHNYCESSEENKVLSISIPFNIRYSVFNKQFIQKTETKKPIEYMKTAESLDGIMPVCWMYRGAWDEFRLNESTIIYCMTRKMLTEKIHSVRKHTSQMGEHAMFLGDDARGFDFRAVQRNINTCALLKRSGILLDYKVKLNSDQYTENYEHIQEIDDEIERVFGKGLSEDEIVGAECYVGCVQLPE